MEEQRARPRPFLKWAGGKRQLLEAIDRLRPSTFGTYHEPFVGGGALFFHLEPARAFLSDTNERLVRTYRGVQSQVERVIAGLSEAPHDLAYFEAQRARLIDEEDDVEVAAWMIYLNKTGFNGLYRVNARNVFNVPFGRYTRPRVCDAPNLRACSAALAGSSVERREFDITLERARPGDFVYFDPPYVPLSSSSSFTAYTAGGFGPEEHRRLRDVALALKQRGVHVLLSNSSAPLVRELYAGGDFELVEVQASRAVNSKGDARGKVCELLIR